MSANEVQPDATLEALELIEALTTAAQRIAMRLEPESVAKEDLLATLSSVQIAIMRVEMDDHGGPALMKGEIPPRSADI